MSTSTSIYQILKAIDLSYENQDFNFETTFDLKKLNISQQRLELLLENLIDDGFVKGITGVRSFNGQIRFSIATPRLTNDGLLYLEENSIMKKAYETLKEARGWIPGFSN